LKVYTQDGYFFPRIVYHQMSLELLLVAVVLTWLTHVFLVLNINFKQAQGFLSKIRMAARAIFQLSGG
jgi:hypothetical protein